MESIENQPNKRKRKMMELSKKLQVLELLDNGDSISSISKLFNVNESTIRTIKKCEKSIRLSGKNSNLANVKSIYMCRDHHVEKVEKSLNIWILNQNNESNLTSIAIRNKAVELHKQIVNNLKGKTRQLSVKPFNASKGWYERFKKRYNINNCKITNDLNHVVLLEDSLSIVQKPLVIGTHDGVFHCDEALAIYLLKKLPTYAHATVLRSRDPKVWAKCDILVDVGGVYNKLNKFDHHQAGFNETLSTVRPEIPNRDIKLSSAGLIYATYGEEVIRNAFEKKGKKLSAEDLKLIYEKIYDYFIKEIDAIDNGVPICEGLPKYTISTCLSSRVSRLNPTWMETVDPYDMTRFEKAVSLVGEEFENVLHHSGLVWWMGKDYVEKAIDSRFTVHDSGKIIELSTFVPWAEHLHSLEEKLGMKEEIQFVIFHSGDNWRAQCVPIVPKSFICRKFLKAEWRGKRDEELCKLSGISGCIFAHHTGFIGGNQTREGAIQMAVSSL